MLTGTSCSSASLARIHSETPPKCQIDPASKRQGALDFPLFLRRVFLRQFINALASMLRIWPIRQNFQIFFVVAESLGIIVLLLVSLTEQNSRTRKIIFIMNGVFVTFDGGVKVALALIIKTNLNILIRLVRIINFRFFGRHRRRRSVRRSSANRK